MFGMIIFSPKSKLNSSQKYSKYSEKHPICRLSMYLRSLANLTCIRFDFRGFWPTTTRLLAFWLLKVTFIVETTTYSAGRSIRSATIVSWRQFMFLRTWNMGSGWTGSGQKGHSLSLKIMSTKDCCWVDLTALPAVVGCIKSRAYRWENAGRRGHCG